MRSPTLSRLYLGVSPDEKLDDWSDERHLGRTDDSAGSPSDGASLSQGPILERGITPMRSVVVAPMRYGRLLLAGDAAHIVPPTGREGDEPGARRRSPPRAGARRVTARATSARSDAYSDESLRRVWRAEEFSTYMTQMLHPHPSDEFENGVQTARLRQVLESDRYRATRPRAQLRQSVESVADQKG